MSDVRISPSELVMDVLERYRDETIPHVVVGPATDEQQREGVVSIIDAGKSRPELYAPLVWKRAQMRCVTPNLEESERLAAAVEAVLDKRDRTVAHQASSGKSYLIHLINVIAGPSMHYDSAETWECLVIAEVYIGTDPIPAT